MERFEYRVLVYDTSMRWLEQGADGHDRVVNDAHEPKALAALLDDYGNDGWELISLDTPGTAWLVRLVLKRRRFD
jgi:hypothetical protein